VATQMAQRARPAFLQRIVRTIRDRQLFDQGHHLLAAVSGGPDSVALLSVLSSLAPAWRLKLTVVHFNYGLRGSESDGDEAFVASWCRERQIPFVVRKPVLTKRRKASSLQARAREVRYEAMKSLAGDIHADRIVTGHTANDQAETMLLWMLRGAGLRGLAGMPFMREELIVRPLLTTTREEVLDYLKHEHLSYRQDSSNTTDRYRRNRIRRELLPVMERITPSIVRLLGRQSDVLRADENYLEQVVDSLYRSLIFVDGSGSQRFERQVFLDLPDALQRRLVRRILRATDEQHCAPTLSTVENVLRFVTGRRAGTLLSVQGADVARDRDRIVVVRRKGSSRSRKNCSQLFSVLPIALSTASSVYWPGTAQKIHVQVMTGQSAEPWLKDRSRECAVFDADRLSEPLVIRSWQPGDRIHPRGMDGKSKKLQDLFTDMKVGREERNRIALLVAPEGILWVVGRREDERFVAGKGTSRCLVVSVGPKVDREGAG
jgi:tRNA(Ile)-lysidine synthase